jgi:hypothetical protein
MAEEVWSNLGFDTAEVKTYVEKSEMMQVFRQGLFSRIVPTIKDIGLWGPKVHECFESLGVTMFESIDVDELSSSDERVAEELDARRAQVQETIAVGAEG